MKFQSVFGFSVFGFSVFGVGVFGFIVLASASETDC